MSLNLLLLGIAITGALLVALSAQRRWPRAQAAAGGLLLSYGVLVVAFGGAELYFRYGYADSRMDFALTGQNWPDRYLQRNSLGYRDREWTTDQLAARTTIFAIGDSFTQGWGINDPADRYTDVLARRLGDDYAVVNIAIAGQATMHHIAALHDYPYQTPDIVLWQYFLNDIEVAAKSNGMTWDITLPDRPPIVDESYLASFLYWGLNREALYINRVDGRDEWGFYYAAYDNPYIWDIHADEINRFIDAVEARGARLITLIFPNLLDPVGSVGYVDRVAQVIAARGHTDILRLYDQAAAWPLEARIVSPGDSHASIAFNALVAELLYDQFFAASR